MQSATTYNGTGKGTDYAIDESILALATLKTYLRVDSDAEDELLKQLRAGAREFVEKHCGIQLRTESDNYKTSFSHWPEGDGLDQLPIYRLPRGPVTAVASVKYYDTSATLQTLTADTDYFVSFADGRGRVSLKRCPSVHESIPYPVEIIYTAGYAADAVPMNIINAIMMICSHNYEFRGDQMPAGKAFPYSDAVHSLLSQHQSFVY